MREILFKAKRLDNGEWVEGTPIFNPNMSKGKILSFAKDLGNDEISFYHYAVDPSTVCQYTGLTDANGTNVFEGDRAVFHTDHEEESDPYVVFWDEKNCRYSVMDEELGGTDSFDMFFANHCTVIGNIHDKEATNAD